MASATRRTDGLFRISAVDHSCSLWVMIIINASNAVLFGVPQRPVLGPILFLLYACGGNCGIDRLCHWRILRSAIALSLSLPLRRETAFRSRLRHQRQFYLAYFPS